MDLDLNWFKANLRGLYPLSDVDFVMEPPLAGPAKNDSNAWIDAVSTAGASNPRTTISISASCRMATVPGWARCRTRNRGLAPVEWPWDMK